MSRTVVAVPGEGIGPEVTEEALRVLEWFRKNGRVDVSLHDADMGLHMYESTGELVSDPHWDAMTQADAVLFGAIGGDGYSDLPMDVKRRRGLLALRRKLGVFANLRPVRAYSSLLGASTLKEEVIDGVDLVVVRELTGGVYFGKPRGIETLPDGTRRGVNTHVYTTGEIRRVGRAAFELARRRRGQVCSVEKSNVMESGKLWQEEIIRLHEDEFSDVALNHLLADNCAMQLIRDPRQFDVIVTDNLFGDVLSDCAAMITGSLGMLPSASLGGLDDADRKPALYEPVHGSAPDIAGRGIANPLGAVLSVALMFRFTFQDEENASLLEAAVENVLEHGLRTADIAEKGKKTVSTRAMGDAVIGALIEIAPQTHASKELTGD